MKKDKKVIEESNQEKAIESALRTGGFVLPKSEEEISEFERIYGKTDVILPEDLQEPCFLYDNSRKAPSTKIRPLNHNNLAMAAREGAGKLPEDIIKKLASDRRKADMKKKPKSK